MTWSVALRELGFRLDSRLVKHRIEALDLGVAPDRRRGSGRAGSTRPAAEDTPVRIRANGRCAQPVDRVPRRYSTTASIVRAPRASATDTR